MIYTMTFNPALDYVIKVPECIMGTVNRTSDEKLLTGGKGINVSTVLTNLKIKNTALGFLSGFTGKIIKDMLDYSGVKNDFIFLESGYSRINVKIKSEQETEINGNGPQIDEEALKKLYKKLDLLSNGDILVLAGSVPKSLPSNIYCEIMKYLSHKNICFVVDAAGKLLTKTLKYNPFLIKPNVLELEEIAGAFLSTDAEIIDAAKRLQELGAANVLISMAADGAILLTENNEVIKSRAIKGKVVNSTGAGDSMVAGFLAGWIEKNDYNYALKMGVAAGSASTFSENLAEKNEIEALYALL